MSQIYDPDYDIPESPGLEPVHVPAKPVTPPPPFLPKPLLGGGLHASSRRSAGDSQSRPSSRLSSHKRRRRPPLGDGVLLSFMNPNYPEVSRLATKVGLPSHSDEESDSVMGDEEDSSTRRSPRAVSPALGRVHIARQATQLLQLGGTSPKSRPGPSPGSAKRSPEAGLDVGGLQISALEPDGSEAPRRRPSSASSAMLIDSLDPNGAVAGGLAERGHVDSLATSPNLRNHTIPDSQGPATEKLPALLQHRQPLSPSLVNGAGGSGTVSPLTSREGGGSGQGQDLPGFSELSKLAGAASHDGIPGMNGYHAHHDPHRASTSSTSGSGTQQQLPTLNQLSPTSGATSGDTSPQDTIFRHLPSSMIGGQQPPTPRYDRRFSHASDHTAASPYPGSSGGHTTSIIMGQPTPDSAEGDSGQHRLSIDRNARMLPLPVASLAVGGSGAASAGVAHVSAQGTATFKCDHPGCNAPPFQTQYLLNSHANVHSQDRPHYCPVPGCPRGEGGRGFKRKNEMIRHGLVHDSPGYVCPFCPEREHKYPRPDNLQRHVRVHHMDKEKDDPLLREVLSQRPEGGNRGRRRRGMGI